MGRRRPQEPEKTQRLSLAELAAHDDVCSDALIDNAYYKARIRKNRTKHFPIRGIKEDEVPRILLHKVIVDKDVVAAEKAFLSLPGLKRYRRSLRTKSEQDHFLSHLRKYIAMYQTDCPWEVSTTNRYTITTYEAAVTARRRIRQGDVVKYLRGTLVPLTAEESTDLDMTNRNFSIVVSARKKNSSIFLGPARFANHDCDANGRLVTRGDDGMEVVAVKNIDVGDEITVSYGDDYFGPGNIDCLCHTCEALERNGWTSKSAILGSDSHASTPAPESLATPQARGLKRKRDSENFSHSSSAPPPSKHLKSTQSPSKLQHSWTPPGSALSDSGLESGAAETQAVIEGRAISISGDEPTLSPPHSPSRPQEREVVEATSTVLVFDPPGPESQKADLPFTSPKNTKARKGPHESKMTARLLGKLSARAPISPAPTSPSSHGSASDPAPSTQPVLSSSSVADTAVSIKVESVEITKVEADEDTIIVAPACQTFARSLETPPDVDERKTEGAALPDPNEVPMPHVVSTMTTTTVTKDVHLPEEPSGQGVETTVLPSIEPGNNSTSVTTLTVHPVTGTIRIAGDYILTRKLLAQPHDRWVQCHNLKCGGFFIQPNGYQTRRECPRCERHSMLYGFPWPKTDPDPRRLLERSGRNKRDAAEYSAYRRKGRCGKGTWVEGGGDEEERVMDHRTIHRFVLPEEEREITRRGLLKEAELIRAAGDHALALLEAKMRAGSGRTESSAVRGGSESGTGGSATPDEARRRSNRFVTRPVAVYSERYHH
ncbi:histone lysine methyltransferase Set9 [Exophiala xenobiotica]|nr:histone lysine methyltransferase Set9 [Exophiala xenobiotica]KAK5189763.1 histone lysine methyltransferase Set9 [Exophiala xenobiotica]KAK5230271.1 histone lysine methyltransferase Set9 [Exophiala xenobiotica]KAK5244782.1 histone lysine methyltransferase Set9 [Exophiala xenobiotica]KAK5265167.1 histone lysine methyltransferase Set9 [Exophiala xenobiotica]